MSRYLLLFLINLPFIIASILTSVTRFKLGRSTKRKMLLQVGFWILILVGIGCAKFIYEWLFNNSLTVSEPLSLFDVVQITAIVTVFYIANRTRTKLEELEIKFRDLHQELSIRLSEDERGKR